MKRLVSKMLVALVLFSWLAGSAFAFSPDNPEQIGLAVNIGHSYDPQPSTGFVQLSLMARYDYEQIMPHRAPDPLKFKIEGNLGLADDSRWRAFCSLNLFAQYYLDFLHTAKLKPYIEAGAGIIYNDFQVDGQGLRINFNPQAGIGTELELGDRQWYAAVRAHHVSNGELYHENRGINSVLLQIGFFLE
jgi:lipid A 3-O-deacylase